MDADFDPLDADFVADPHPTYARLRRECPVAYSSRWDFWTVTRYADVVHVTANPELFTSAEGITVPPNQVSGRRAPMHFDPPEHTDFRRVMNRPFRDDRVLAFEEPLRHVARHLLEPLLTDPDADYGIGYTSRLATAALGLLLGIDDADVDFLEEHSRGFEDAQFRLDADRAEAENLLLYDSARILVARRRGSRLDPDDDILSSLVAFVDRRPDLDDEFVTGSLRQLFIAAHVAPRVAIAGVLAHVAEDAAVQEQLRTVPTDTPHALDELLRLHAPNQGFSRTAVRDVELSGCTIRKGQQVALAYPSANRDEEVFPDPDPRTGTASGRGT